MSKLTNSQSNTNLIMLCPYMNRFANSSFSNSNRTFSSVSGLSNPSGLYGRTRSLIIKPLLSNAATISICSRCDTITTAADNNSNQQTSSSNNDNHHNHNENGQTTSTATTATANQGSHNDHNRTISNTFEHQQQEQHQDEEDHENYRHVEPAQPDNVSVSYSTAEHQPTLSTQTFSNNYHQSNYINNNNQAQTQQLHDPISLLSDSKPSTRPLSRRLSQHLIYPLIQQSSSQLHLNHHSSRHHAAPPPPPPPPQPQEQQPKRHLNNPVIALIAHDLLKFMEEENHYRKARENLKSDVEKIRRSRHSSAVRHKNVNSGGSSGSSKPTITMNSNVSNSSGVTYYTNINSNKLSNNVVSSSASSTSKPRARSSVPAFRNSYSNASLAKEHSFYYNTKPIANNTSQSNNNYHHHISKVAHTSKPAPPPVHASSTINTNELIDKLILQVYAQK